ncbi:SH3 domain-containing YSC84-like protein 1, partial [Phenoliferia sp. Uapishka_3]
MWESVRTASGATWNGLYKVSDTVGAYTNKQAAKVRLPSQYGICSSVRRDRGVDPISHQCHAQIGTEAFYPTSLDLECSKAARILRTFTSKPNTSLRLQPYSVDASDLPEDSLSDQRKRQRVLKKIPPSVGAAFFGSERCSDLSYITGNEELSRPGAWSGPSGILLHTLGVGFMAGADIYDVVLLLRTSKAVQSFTKPRVTLGGEISIAAGPVGNGVMLETGVELSPVWSYVKSKGLYGGVQIDGNVMIERNDENERSYGRVIKASEILSGEESPRYWCEGLHQTILAAEGEKFSAHMIPQGASPSEFAPEPRRLPPEELDEEDLAARREMEEAMRSFGIEDPLINHKARAEDPEILSGADLYALSPTLSSSGTSSPLIPSGSSRDSSLVYPLSVGSGKGSPPPPLPPRKSAISPIDVEVDSAPNEVPKVSGELERNSILSDDVESPEESVGLSRQGSSASSKPPVPPRRSPRVLQEESMTPVEVMQVSDVTKETAAVVEGTTVGTPVEGDKPKSELEPKLEVPEMVYKEEEEEKEEEAPTLVTRRASTVILSDPDLAPPPTPRTPATFEAFSSRASVLLNKEREPTVAEEFGSPALEDPLDEGDDAPRWGLPTKEEAEPASEAGEDSFEDAHASPVSGEGELEAKKDGDDSGAEKQE